MKSDGLKMPPHNETKIPAQKERIRLSSLVQKMGEENIIS